MHEEVNEEQGVREAMLAVGDGTTRSSCSRRCLRAARSRKFLDRNGPGVQQVAYTVDGHRRGVGARCASAGCGCSTTQPRRGTSDSRVNFIHPKDAGGVLVELVEPAA